MEMDSFETCQGRRGSGGLHVTTDTTTTGTDRAFRLHFLGDEPLEQSLFFTRLSWALRQPRSRPVQFWLYDYHIPAGFDAADEQIRFC